MEKITIDHSFKDIPIPSKQEYKNKLLEKMESFIGRMRWEAHRFLQVKKNRTDPKNNYGFRTQNNPPYIKPLKCFENELIGILNLIQFEDCTSKYQRALIQHVNKIKKSDSIFVKTDKTGNIYKMPFSDYNKLLKNSITKNYKKTDPTNSMECTINNESKEITDQLQISNRVGRLAKKEAYLLLKDHKENFINDPKVRLICPAKTEVGKISSAVLKEVVASIKDKLKLNLWSNTNEATSWFIRMNQCRGAAFIQFDIADFYPSISEELFDRVIEFAKIHTEIEDEKANIIRACRKTAVYYNGDEWVKTSNDGLFDVTMGSWDGAQVADLVGLYILSLLTNESEMNTASIGLYRDDGLLIIENSNAQKCERIKKKLITLMNSLGLKIEVAANLKVVNFLDVTLNLNSFTYKPYKKENAKIKYVNTKSNHPPAVIKQIPNSIQKRLSNNSSNEEIFHESIDDYNDALKKSGFKGFELKYEPNGNPNRRKKASRSRRIIWFNPPFNKQVRTNIGKMFFNLISKHFPQEHPLHKIFNKNTIKLSYSCMDNFERIIKKHNNKIIRNSTAPKTEATRNCSCHNKNNCPLQNQCLTRNVVYKATVSIDKKPENDKHYIGISHTTFKARLYNHHTSFSKSDYKNDTSLATHIWKLKEDKTPYNIKWEIITRAPTCNSLNSTCQLCLLEKMHIVSFPNKKALLNRRSEISIKCKHKAEFLLKTWKSTGTS